MIVVGWLVTTSVFLGGRGRSYGANVPNGVNCSFC